MKRLFLVENGISKNENDFPMALLSLPMVTWLFVMRLEYLLDAMHACDMKNALSELGCRE